MHFHHSPGLKQRARFFFVFALWLILACASGAQAALQVEVTPEEPSGVFWASDTLKTQTELLFSISVRNDLDTERPVYLYWKVLDASGKTRLKDNAKFPLAPRAAAVRRVLFPAPSRGAYLLVVEAVSKRDGPDDQVTVESPFAVVVTPTEGYRPRSFFGITAPTLLKANDLLFYKRIGARVLRSEWMPGAPSTPGGEPLTSASLDTQLQARLAHSLATQGVLSYQPGFGADVWTRQAANTAQRYRGIEQWEAGVDLPPAALNDFVIGFKATRPDAQLFAPMPQGLLPSQLVSGWTTTLPLTTQPGQVQETSAAITRLLLAQSERARDSVSALQVNQEFGGDADAMAAASEMVERYVMSISAGASGFSAAIPTAHTQGIWSRQRLTAMAKAAAFTHMAMRLENTSFSREVWSHLPSLWGTVFKSPTQSIAVIWSDTAEAGQIKVQWPATPNQSATRVYDIFGNPIAQAENGRLTLPVGPTPVYVVSSTGPNEAAEAIGKGDLSSLPEMAAHALPVTQLPLNEKAAPLRVVLQNVAIEPLEGTLQLSPPRGWKLSEDKRNFTLKPGEYATYEFPVERARLEDDGQYPVRISASTKRGRWQWKQTLRTATATNVRADEEMSVDGVLNEWADAAWMRVISPVENAALQDAQVALKWSLDNLFIAAQVRENKLTPRDEAAPEYSFWNGSDAIQLAFGLRDEPWMRPARGRFRDTDYGFLLSPFRALGSGTVEARMLRLWTPKIPFGDVPDRVRYGGIVPGARCVITRDETTGITNYEAVLPLREMPQLNPAMRLAGSTGTPPVRFGWVAHNETGPPLQWGRATDTFAWWGNPGSLLPADALHFAVQTELGFTQRGETNNAAPLYVAPSGTAPIQPVAPPRPVATPRPTPRPRPTPPSDTAPMPIDLLPPAAPFEGDLLPPSTP